jgi:hypothetical protein
MPFQHSQHSPGWTPPCPSRIKSAAVANGVKVGALGIRFSGPDSKDLAGDYFDSATDLGPTMGQGAVVMINHGQPFGDSPILRGFADIVLGTADVKRDSSGLFVSTTLDVSDPLQEALASLVSLGTLRWSSGTSGHVAKRADDGRILRWWPVEFSLCACPCEPRLPALRRL